MKDDLKDLENLEDEDLDIKRSDSIVLTAEQYNTSEEDKIILKETKIMPMVALRGKVLFPNTMLNFDVGRPYSVVAVNKAAEVRSPIFIASQKSAYIDSPKQKDICSTGVIAIIKQIIRLPNNTIKISVEAISRAKIKRFIEVKDFFSVEVEESPYQDCQDTLLLEAYLRVAKNAFTEYTLFEKRITICFQPP